MDFAGPTFSHPPHWFRGTMIHLKISKFNSIEEAPKFGKEVGYLELTEANIVNNGTIEGRQTVDLVFVDNAGRKHVAMTTARMLQALASSCGPQKH